MGLKLVTTYALGNITLSDDIIFALLSDTFNKKVKVADFPLGPWTVYCQYSGQSEEVEVRCWGS